MSELLAVAAPALPSGGAVAHSIFVGIKYASFGLLALIPLSLIMIYFLYDYRVIIRSMTGENQSSLWRWDWARAKKTKKGNWELKCLLKPKVFMPMPPDHVVGVTKNGRKFVQAVESVTGTIDYMKASQADIAKLEPINNTDRSAYVDEMERVAKRRESWKQVAVPLAAISILGLVLVMGIVMFPKMAEAQLQLSNANGQIASQQAETVRMQTQILGKLDSIIGKAYNTPPQESNPLPSEPPG